MRIDHAAARDRSLENVRKITLIVAIATLAGCLVSAVLLKAADPLLAAASPSPKHSAMQDRRTVPVAHAVHRPGTPARPAVGGPTTVRSGAAHDDASWTILRATGAVDLGLLTLAVVLGVAVLARTPIEVAPRAVFVLVHRNTSLLSVALLIAHVVAAVLLLHLGVVRSLIPFTSHVRRGYLGLGVLGADLMMLLAATSVLRVRLGLKHWRQMHWAAYPAWAAAVVHGAAPGTDRLVPWVGWLDVLCVVAVLAAASVRAAQFARDRPLWVLGTGAAAAFAVVGFVTWVHGGQEPASGERTAPVKSVAGTPR